MPGARSCASIRIGIEKHGDLFTLNFSRHDEPLHPIGASVSLRLQTPFQAGIGFCAHISPALWSPTLYSKTNPERSGSSANRDRQTFRDSRFRWLQHPFLSRQVDVAPFDAALSAPFSRRLQANPWRRTQLRPAPCRILPFYPHRLLRIRENTCRLPQSVIGARGCACRFVFPASREPVRSTYSLLPNITPSVK